MAKFRSTAPRTKSSKRKWRELAASLSRAESRNVSLPGSWIVEDYNRYCRLLAELQRRREEALALYEPLDHARAFHACRAGEQLVVGSNRGGKTAGVSSEVGWAATGTHPVEGKYPRDGMEICCIGSEVRHLSLMFKYLFEPGQFKVFKHPDTRLWHVANPNEPDHLAFQHLWKKSKPIIPRRMLKNIAWEDKKLRAPNVVRLHNGTNFYFYSGLAVGLPQGWKFHLVWIDEEIKEAEAWLDELRPRLIDYNGSLIWSATPQRATETFKNLYVKSQEPDMDSRPNEQQTRAFFFDSRKNKFLPKAGLKGYVSKVEDDPITMRIRVEGKFAYDELLAYPEYTPELYPKGHLLPRFPLRPEDTRYVLIDPGRDEAGVLFLVCPAPAKERDVFRHAGEEMARSRPCIIAYAELRIRNANAALVAAGVRDVLTDYANMTIQDFTIDLKGGRNRWANEGNALVQDIYADELRKLDVKPRRDFWEYGSTDRKYGVEMVKRYLMDDPEPHFFHFPELKWLRHQFTAWKKLFNRQGVMTGYEDKNRSLLDPLRYGCTRELVWIPPPDTGYKGSTLTASKLKKLGQKIKRGQFFTIGGRKQ